MKNENPEIYEKHSRKLINHKRPLVSIVTTAYKNEHFNKKYFDSVNNQTYRNIEVIFVDNLSPDNTVKSAKKLLKNGKIIASKINTGCAGGNNLGASEAKGKYIFLLGPDAWVDRRCVELLVKKAEKSPEHIYAPKQMTYDGSEFISCGVSADLFGYPARTYAKDGEKQIRKIFYADGSGVFMKLKNYLKVGMMDETTFLFAEDVDLSWKCHMMGFKVIPVKDAAIYHFSGGSVGIGGYPKGKERYATNSNRRFMAERNIIRNILKNYRWFNVIWVLTFYLLINLFEALALLFSGQSDKIRSIYINAYIWNIKNFRSTLSKRKLIQSVRKTGDIKVMGQMYFVPHKFYALLELGIPRIN